MRRWVDGVLVSREDGTSIRPRWSWLALSLVLGTGLLTGMPATAQPGRGPSPVAVAPVIQRDVATGRPFVGTVYPLRISQVGSTVEERVVAFEVEQGDRVEQGAVLARLRTTRLEIQRSVAQAELNVRRQELAELENGSRPEEIVQVEARYRRTQAAREAAQSRYLRARSLFASAKVSPQELEDARVATAQAEQEEREAEALLELARQGPRLEQIERARAQVLVQKETIRQLEDEIAQHTIRAPFAGYVVREQTQMGQWVSKGGAVATIADLDTVDVRVAVPEDDEVALQLGSSVRVVLPALIDYVFEGTLVAIVPEADPRSRSFPVIVRITNPHDEDGPLIKAGQFARAMLPVGPRRGAVLVPKDALVIQGGDASLFVVEDLDGSAGRPELVGRVRAVPIEAGIAYRGWIEVDGDVEPDQLVVVRGNERLRPGAEVRISRTFDVNELLIPGDRDAAASLISNGASTP